MSSRTLGDTTVIQVILDLSLVKNILRQESTDGKTINGPWKAFLIGYFNNFKLGLFGSFPIILCLTRCHFYLF